MISQDTYLNAVPMAQELEARGIRLKAAPSTVLSELIDLSVSPETIQSTMPKTLLGNPATQIDTMYTADVQYRANDVALITGAGGEQTQHDLKIEALADDLAPFVRQHISFARNTVVPLITGFADKLTHFMQVARPLDPASLFEIVQRDIPAIVQDESFTAGGLENYTGKYMDWVQFPGMLELSDDPAFYDNLMDVGNERQNALVKEWLNTLPEGYVRAIYVRVFSTQQFGAADTLNGCLMEDPGKYSNPYDTIDHALAIYIMGNRLINDVQPTQGMSLMKYKQAMRDMIDYAGNMLIAGMKTAQRQIAGNTLVSEAVFSKKRIVVNKSIYRAWIANGGSPEVLYGMMAAGTIQYSVDAINALKEKALTQWGMYTALTQTEIKSDMRRRFRAFVETEIELGLQEPMAMEAEYKEGKSGINAKILTLVKQELDCLGDCAMDDIYGTALLLIAKCRFFYTSSYLMLKEMADVAKENPAIDQREAALLGAAIAYLATYFVDQTSAA